MRTLPDRRMKVCQRGAWNTRMLIETVLSMLTTVCHLKHQHHWQADYFRARMAFIIAAQPYMEVGRWSLNRLPLELANVQAVIEPAPIEQRLMRALLDDLARFA
jgi:hypothetical protein